MAATEAELITQTTNGFALYKELFIALQDDSGADLASVRDTFQQSLEGDFAPDMGIAALALQAALLNVYQDASLASAIIANWLRITGFQGGDDDRNLSLLFQYMTANSEAVKSRVITFGAVSAGGGNTGDGTIHRVTKGQADDDIEAGAADVKTFRCIDDANGDSSRNQEQFSVEGAIAPVAEFGGSGTVGGMTSRVPADGILLNPSFDEFAGTFDEPTEILNWTPSVAVSASTFTFDSTNIFLPALNANTTPYALNVLTSCTLTQRLDLGGIGVPKFQPVFCGLAYNREVNSAAGTLEVHLGTKSQSVVLAAQTGYNFHQFLATPNDGDSWLANFTEDALDAKIVWTRTGGTGLLLDDFYVIAYDFFDGLWYIIRPGQTPFVAGSVIGNDGDTFTFTDSETGSIIQREIARKFGRYLPHATGGSITIADP